MQGTAVDGGRPVGNKYTTRWAEKEGKDREKRDS